MENNNNSRQWLIDYFNLYNKFDYKDQIDKLISLKDLWLKASSIKKKIIFCGNGGSAAMASHCAVDLTKNAGIRAINFNEADLITCFANDFGYENWISNALRFYAESNDVVVLISSSGRSQNIINAAKYAKKNDMNVVTFTGFDDDNPLKSLGDINFWVNSHAYNIVEMTHHIWILGIVDMIIGSSEYSA